MLYRRLQIILLAVVCLLLVTIGVPRQTSSRTQTWTSADHPRLITSPAEKSALQAKLSASGSVSKTIWDDFLVTNFKNSARDYADGAVLYWLNNDSAAGQLAISHANNFMTQYPNGLIPVSYTFNEEWYHYVDLLLTYDFAYDLLTPAERTTFKDFIALQGSLCSAKNAGWEPGNANTLWMFCEYGSAMLLEGENYSKSVVDEVVTRGTTTNGFDDLHFPKDATNIKITNASNQPVADYTLGIDFTYAWVSGCGGICINWAPGGNEPARGVMYYVSYTFAPNVAEWKSIGRRDLEYHLNYHWTDGYYNGGLNPYGSLVTEELPLFFEMIKRDTGVDYRQNEAFKRIVDMYTYSKLPSVPDGVLRRFNTISDTAGWTNYDADAWSYPSPSFWSYRSWLRPFIAWASTVYANDPAGYGERYVWLWTQAYRNANGTIRYTAKPDWREAFWINDAAIGPYLNSTAVPDATWPLQRYFRGKEVIITKTEDWNAPNTNAAYISMVAGNHNYISEHDHGDAGSFTFFSLNNDWAIDPGYGDDSSWGAYLAAVGLEDHNSVGIDGTGYNTTGTYGASGSNPIFGGFAHFGDVALTDDASAMYTDLAHAWTLTDVPYVQRDDRYVVAVNGAKQSYMIVADDIAKDASKHSYEWYLHTGTGNTVSIDGRTATITGERTGGLMKLYSLGPEAVTITQSQADISNLGSHPVIKVQTDGTTAARFLHLLIPSNSSNPAPTVTSIPVTGGTQATVTWADGTVDTILWYYSGDAITSSDGVVSDAKVTVTRQESGTINGLVAVRGRSVVQGSNTLLTVLDGSAPVTVSAMGSTVGLYAADSARIGVGLPNVTAATLEDGTVSIPVTNDGTTAWVNGGRSLADMRRGGTVRYNEDFSSGYPTIIARFNYDKAPAEQFGIVNNALELRATSYDWPSITKRDSTQFRRTGIYPTTIPPLDHGDGTYTFRYRFADPDAATRKFRIYTRTHDRTVGDWATNQDYVRLELNAVTNQATIGQRVNGPWAWNGDNNTLTSSLPSVATTLNDTEWHTVAIKLIGNAVTLTVDGNQLLDTTLTTSIPTAPAIGYIQFQVEGTSAVLLDSVNVTIDDTVVPAAPTGGELVIAANGTGQLRADYGQGASTDADKLVLLESAQPIQSTDDSSTMKILATFLATETAGSFTGGDNNAYHALMVADQAGNESMLTPLSLDKTAPAAVNDLLAQ